MAESDKDKVMYADVAIGSVTVMFMDMPAGSPLVKGNNITPTVSMRDKVEVERIFNELKVNGKVFMELQQTFFSDLYGMIEDQFGVIWQILHYNCEEN
jgi:PhnB protein